MGDLVFRGSRYFDAKQIDIESDFVSDGAEP